MKSVPGIVEDLFKANGLALKTSRKEKKSLKKKERERGKDLKIREQGAVFNLNSCWGQ